MENAAAKTNAKVVVAIACVVVASVAMIQAIVTAAILIKCPSVRFEYCK